MLPAAARLRRSSEFAIVIRRGRRSRRGQLVVHAATDFDGPPRFGFVVGKTVGNAVMRHRVARRLRHAAAAFVSACPAGSAVVVRALPEAGSANYHELARDLGDALARALPGMASR